MHPGARFPNRAFLCLVSGCYIVQKNGAFPPQPILIEHCCLMTEGNSWDISVKCRPHSNQCEREKNWQNVMEVYPNAKVQRKHNDIELTLPVLTENLEVAAFGVPKKNDQKRMQMTIFGKDPKQGCNWKIRVYLINDSKKAFKVICEKEAEKGNRLLTTIAGLFVSNSKENIRIEFTDLDPGWQMKGGNVKIIDIGDAWNSPEDSANFPLCIFEVSHVDQTKQQFFCRITVSHDDDSANTEMVAFFEKTRGVGTKPLRKRKNAPMKPPRAKNIQLKDILRCVGPRLNRGSRGEWIQCH